MPAWLIYSLIRIGIFAVVFAVVSALGLQWFWAAVVATVVALCLSFIFFRRQRSAMSTELADRRRRPGSRPTDDDIEDEALDADEHRAADSAG